MKISFNILFVINIIINTFFASSQITDVNGKTYKTVLMGSQTWMAENLNVDKFRNGDVIPEAKTPEELQKYCDNKQPAWHYYQFNSSDKFGKMYNQYAVYDNRGLAPIGYHIPKIGSVVSNYECIVCLDEIDTLNNYIETNNILIDGKPIFKEIIKYGEIEGHYPFIWVACSNCKNWNSEYKKKVPCHVCKDQRGKFVKGKYIPKSKIEIGRDKIWLGNERLTASGFNAKIDDSTYYHANFWLIDINKIWAREHYYHESWDPPFNYCSFNAEYGTRFMTSIEGDFKSERPFSHYVRCIKD
jgi:hypothetical protein